MYQLSGVAACTYIVHAYTTFTLDNHLSRIHPLTNIQTSGNLRILWIIVGSELVAT